MFKGILIAFLVVLTYAGVHAQQAVTLEDLLAKAVQYYPLARQKESIKNLGDENIRIQKKKEDPVLDVAGQATYQSEVTAIDFPGIPTPTKDNYDIGLELRYPLTDFGINSTKRKLEQLKTGLSLDQNEVDNLKLKDRVTNLFGNILLQQENKKILLLRKAELESQHAKIVAAVSGGAVLKSNQLVFESEILVAEQKVADVDAVLQGLLSELSLVTGVSLNMQTAFSLPVESKQEWQVVRPELNVFKSQLSILNSQQDLLKRESKAHLFVFGQGYYGRPGYNILNYDFRPYGIAGLGISWNINDVSLLKNKLKSLDINRQMVQQQQEIFNINLQSALAQKQAEIDKYPLIISKDEAIVSKRKEIMKVASSQLENGAITSTEFITELNAENTAELNLAFHKVQQVFAKEQYRSLTGN